MGSEMCIRDRFWVDRNLDVLPPRPEAQPELVFRKPEPGSADDASSAEVKFFSPSIPVTLSQVGQMDHTDHTDRADHTYQIDQLDDDLHNLDPDLPL